MSHLEERMEHDLNLIREQVEATGIAPIEIWNEDGQPVN